MPQIASTHLNLSPAAFQRLILRVRVRGHGERRRGVSEPRRDDRDRHAAKVHRARDTRPVRPAAVSVTGHAHEPFGDREERQGRERRRDSRLGPKRLGGGQQCASR